MPWRMLMLDAVAGPRSVLAQQVANKALVAPIVLLIVIVGGAALVVLRLRRRARSGPGRCRGCGYDLAGISGPCPECGR